MSYQKEDASCWYRYYQTILISLPSTMQSHTCTVSGSLSFWCDSVPLEAVGSRTLSCLVHQRPLPTLVILGYYMPTSFRLVRPRTTSYWKRSALIPFVTSQTVLSIADWPYKPTRVFLACFVLTRTLTGKLPGRSPIQRLIQVKHASLWSSYRMGYQKEDTSCWYR